MKENYSRYFGDNFLQGQADIIRHAKEAITGSRNCEDSRNFYKNIAGNNLSAFDQALLDKKFPGSSGMWSSRDQEILCFCHNRQLAEYGCNQRNNYFPETKKGSGIVDPKFLRCGLESKENFLEFRAVIKQIRKIDDKSYSDQKECLRSTAQKSCQESYNFYRRQVLQDYCVARLLKSEQFNFPNPEVLFGKRIDRKQQLYSDSVKFNTLDPKVLNDCNSFCKGGGGLDRCWDQAKIDKGYRVTTPCAVMKEIKSGKNPLTGNDIKDDDRSKFQAILDYNDSDVSKATSKCMNLAEDDNFLHSGKVFEDYYKGNNAKLIILPARYSEFSSRDSQSDAISRLTGKGDQDWEDCKASIPTYVYGEERCPNPLINTLPPMMTRLLKAGCESNCKGNIISPPGLVYERAMKKMANTLFTQMCMVPEGNSFQGLRTSALEGTWCKKELENFKEATKSITLKSESSNPPSYHDQCFIEHKRESYMEARNKKAKEAYKNLGFHLRQLRKYGKDILKRVGAKNKLDGDSNKHEGCRREGLHPTQRSCLAEEDEFSCFNYEELYALPPDSPQRGIKQDKCKQAIDEAIGTATIKEEYKLYGLYLDPEDENERCLIPYQNKIFEKKVTDNLNSLFGKARDNDIFENGDINGDRYHRYNRRGGFCSDKVKQRLDKIEKESAKKVMEYYAKTVIPILKTFPEFQGKVRNLNFNMNPESLLQALEEGFSEMKPEIETTELLLAQSSYSSNVTAGLKDLCGGRNSEPKVGLSLFGGLGAGIDSIIDEMNSDGAGNDVQKGMAKEIQRCINVSTEGFNETAEHAGIIVNTACMALAFSPLAAASTIPCAAFGVFETAMEAKNNQRIYELNQSLKTVRESEDGEILTEQKGSDLNPILIASTIAMEAAFFGTDLIDLGDIRRSAGSADDIADSSTTLRRSARRSAKDATSATRRAVTTDAELIENFRQQYSDFSRHLSKEQLDDFNAFLIKRAGCE